MRWEDRKPRDKDNKETARAGKCAAGDCKQSKRGKIKLSSVYNNVHNTQVYI